MALFIVGSYKASPYDPDSAFDPVTHIATEASFIQLLEHGVYDSKYIGYKVQLGNSVDYNNGLWVIADVNHDSANTGQTDCYDLISEDCFHSGAFASSNNNWRNSKSRTWLNNTFYPGFSEAFKARMLNIKYKLKYSWYTDDKIISPSYTELNGDVDNSYATGYNYIEGVKYSIFNNGASARIKQYSDSNSMWWTRSQDSSNDYSVWYVNTDGSMYASYYSVNSLYTVPLMRVH